MAHGTAATGRPPAMKAGRHGREDRGIAYAKHAPLQSRFGFMFDLAARPDVSPTPDELGLSDGPMDGKAVHNDSAKLAAALTYFGQFIDHDITLDLTSSLEKEADPEASVNFRTPALELDSVYALGPSGSPHLYDTRPDNANKMLVGPTVDGTPNADLPRNSQGIALLGDPRNDENLIVAQLHVAMLKFHNVVVDQLAKLDDGIADDPSPFAKAQRLTRWHYQWLVLRQFLPAIAGAQTVEDVLKNGRQIYLPRTPEVPERGVTVSSSDVIPFIPVEFSVAAYRFGHSMVQPGYAINDQFGAVLFPPDPSAAAASTGLSRDLRGGPIRADEKVNWKNFIDTGVPMSPNAVTRFSSKIDPRLAGPLLNLPNSVVPPGVPANQRSLAFRNLRRAVMLKLPSGQDVAALVKNAVPTVRLMTDADLWHGTSFAGAPAPLWYYLLREAEVQHGGEQLGDVGGRIVAEVLIGLLQLDKCSFLSRRASWKPLVEGRARKDDFDLVDFFRIAGTDVD